MSALTSLQQRVLVPTTRVSTRRVLCVAPRANNKDIGDQAKSAISDVSDQAKSAISDVGDQMKQAANNATSGLRAETRDSDGRDAASYGQGAANKNFYAPTPELEKPSMNPSNPNQYPVGFGAISELANSRLAMLGFAAAIGAELFTGRSVWEQINWSPSTPYFIAATFVTFIIASYVPAVKGAKLRAEANNAFTPVAELTNGRLAMIGWVGLLVAEALKGGALIGA